MSTRSTAWDGATPGARPGSRSHFEQRSHVRHRLDRHGAAAWLDYQDPTPEVLADAIGGTIEGRPSYRSIDPRNVERAAALISELL